MTKTTKTDGRNEELAQTGRTVHPESETCPRCKAFNYNRVCGCTTKKTAFEGAVLVW